MLGGPANTPSVVTFGQIGPYSVASSGLLHLAGRAGGRHRRGPTGGAAYGMPKNVSTPFLTRPRTGPFVVRIRGCAPRAALRATSAVTSALAPLAGGEPNTSRTRSRKRATPTISEPAVRNERGADTLSHRQSQSL